MSDRIPLLSGPQETKVLAVKLPPDLYKAVHHRSVDEGRSVKAIVEEALTRFIEKEKNDADAE